jgi:meiotically up-regulated gene 157 (Mug157) protein
LLTKSLINAGKKAMSQIVTVLKDQSYGSWSSDWEYISYFNWTGLPGSLSGPVTNGGNGEPRKANGLVGSHHRPSDDICVFSKSVLFTSFLDAMI